MRILLIEDEPPAARRLRKILEAMLEDLGGMGPVPAEIAWAGDPAEALQEAARQPDLIFLDLNLGGFQTLEWLRAARLPADRVIVVSADTRYADEAFALGVFAYVFKPIDAALLGSHVERFVRGRNLIA